MATKKKGPEPEVAGPAGGQAPGMPMQGMPMQGMPVQGMPMQQMQGMPMQQMPGMPMQQMPGMPMQQMPGMPMQQMQGMPMQQMPMQQMPGGMPGYGQMNPMLQLMQMMQGMQGFMGNPGYGIPFDAVATPFAQAKPDGDPGLDAAIIRPATLSNLVKEQEALALGNVLDLMCLTGDGKHALGGIPKACTIVFVGPPGRGKTRTALASLARVAAAGHKVAFVVAEEGFHDEEGSGRDDLASRMVKVGMTATGLDQAAFTRDVLQNVFVLEAQYHKSTTWDDFIKKYRYLVEKEGIDFVVIDSLNMIDPTRHDTANHLAALKTYNHEMGVTCVCIGQIKDTGDPVGGEALQHTADVVFLLEEMSLGSKEIAEFWGGKYRDKISVLHVVKSVTTPTLAFPVRVDRQAPSGELTVHAAQPAEYALLPKRG